MYFWEAERKGGEEKRRVSAYRRRPSKKTDKAHTTIAIAIPLAYLRAIGAAARRGVIIKGGLHLETRYTLPKRSPIV